jgi:hypothetical protein
MKYFKSSIPITMLLAVLLLGGLATGETAPSGMLAHAQTIGPVAPRLCSEQTIQGRYGFISSGSGGPPTLSIDTPGPLTGVGIVSFATGGAFTLVTTRSVNGNIDSKPQALTGTYKVNGDCTLTMSFAVGFTFRAIIVDGGKEIRFIETDPGTTFIVVAKRI